MLWQNNGDNTIIVLEIKVNNSIIQTKEDKMTIDEVFEDLITPVLLAAGYSSKNIEDRICDGCG